MNHNQIARMIFLLKIGCVGQACLGSAAFSANQHGIVMGAQFLQLMFRGFLNIRGEQKLFIDNLLDLSFIHVAYTKAVVYKRWS
ncbi:hypothetical protein D3C80_1937960 [compost metagenome]